MSRERAFWRVSCVHAGQRALEARASHDLMYSSMGSRDAPMNNVNTNLTSSSFPKCAHFTKKRYFASRARRRMVHEQTEMSLALSSPASNQSTTWWYVVVLCLCQVLILRVLHKRQSNYQSQRLHLGTWWSARSSMHKRNIPIDR